MNDGPSFCWHCGGKLKLPYFATVIDPVTHYGYTVHKCCKESATESLKRSQLWAQDLIRETHAHIHPEDTF